MSEILRINTQQWVMRAGLFLMLVVGLLAPYQAAQAWIISFGPGGTITFSLRIAGGSYDPVTDVYFYNKSAAADPSKTPVFRSPNNNTGTWYSGFVQYGPGSESGEECRKLPKGGVRFFTEGEGIGKGQSATFSFVAKTEDKDWLVSYFDTNINLWVLNVEPTLGEPPRKPPVEPRSSIENTSTQDDDPPRFDRNLILILILLGAAYWYYTDRKKKRGPPDNDPDTDKKDPID